MPTVELVLDNSKIFANCFEEGCVAGPWTIVDLSQVIIGDPGPTVALYTGGRIVNTPTFQSALGIPDLVIDSATYYEFEVTNDVDAGDPLGGGPTIVTSTPVITDPVELFDADWYDLGHAADDTTLVETIRIGPGIDDWSEAFADEVPPQAALIQTRYNAKVSQIRWRTVCPPNWYTSCVNIINPSSEWQEIPLSEMDIFDQFTDWGDRTTPVPSGLYGDDVIVYNPAMDPAFENFIFMHCVSLDPSTDYEVRFTRTRTETDGAFLAEIVNWVSPGPAPAEEHSYWYLAGDSASPPLTDFSDGGNGTITYPLESSVMLDIISSLEYPNTLEDLRFSLKFDIFTTIETIEIREAP